MSIPSIEAYPVPQGSALPRNKVAWKPDAARGALLIHDMQDYFLRFYDRKAQPIVSMLENIRALRDVCHARGIPVIYTAQPPTQSAEERGLLNDMWGPGMTADPASHAIVESLRPEGDDIVLTKYRYSAFHRTNLLELLRARGRDQLFICGVYAHIGCLLTAADAFMNDVQPFFVADAVADFSSHYHELALGYAAERCAVTLLASELGTALAGATQDDGLSHAWLHGRIAALLDVELGSVGRADNLFDLGFDSIRLMTLVEQLRERGAEVTFADVAERWTIDAMWDLVETARARGVEA